MEEKSIVARISKLKDIVLSISDIQQEASKRLPAFKRGWCLSLQGPIPTSNSHRILQLRLNRPSNRSRELNRLLQIPSPVPRPQKRLKSRHQHHGPRPQNLLPTLRLPSRSARHGSPLGGASYLASLRKTRDQHGRLVLLHLLRRGRRRCWSRNGTYHARDAAIHDERPRETRAYYQAC